jgi:hypothetical protein
MPFVNSSQAVSRPPVMPPTKVPKETLMLLVMMKAAISGRDSLPVSAYPRPSVRFSAVVSARVIIPGGRSSSASAGRSRIMT